jgi:hypothetical protein
LTSRFLGFPNVEGKSNGLEVCSTSGSHRPGFVLTLLDFFHFVLLGFSCFSVPSWLRSRCPRPRRDFRPISRLNPAAILVTKACMHRCLILHLSFRPATLTPPTPNRRPLNIGNGPHCPHSHSILVLNSHSPLISPLRPCRILAPGDIVGAQASSWEPISW